MASSTTSARGPRDPNVASSKDSQAFRPALIVVDMQEDFCPPNGSLAVEGARSLTPLINSLLSLPGFVFRVATLDFHPVGHISFASSHPGPDNRPGESVVEVRNPLPDRKPGAAETIAQKLWPVHCVQGTPGSAIIPEIDTGNIDMYVTKGMDKRVDMYSAFLDAFGNEDPAGNGSVNADLSSALRGNGATDVFIVGVAGEYCVKFTAIDAFKKGFRTWVIEEGTKCVVPGSAWEDAKEEMRARGVHVIAADGPELARVREPKGAEEG